VAILSTFYDTSAGVPASLVTEIKWAEAHPYVGASTYGCAGAGDFKVTAHPTLPNTVNVATGKAWGWGVLDKSDAIETVTCTPPAAGTSRWDLICIRRDWTPSAGGPTTIAKVEGGATKQIPAGRNKNPGTLDDQPIALVQWTAGQSQPSNITDLRCWASNGGMTAVDDLALTYLDSPGAAVSIQGSTWYHGIGLNGTASWGKAFSTGKIPLFGVGPAVLAGSVGSTSDFLIQSGTLVAYTDNSGYARVTFPNPFPNGLVTCILQNGDSSIDRAFGHVISMTIAGLPWNTGRRTDVVYSVAVEDSQGPDRPQRVHMCANQLHRVNYIAIGW
jgi:hypothetical protein